MIYYLNAFAFVIVKIQVQFQWEQCDMCMCLCVYFSYDFGHPILVFVGMIMSMKSVFRLLFKKKKINLFI